MKQDFESLKKQYIKNGYVIIDTQLDVANIDGAREDLEKYFGENREHPIHVPYADQGRIQDAWHISQNVFALAQSQRVLDVLQYLYDAPAKPFQTLNFYKGTEQAVHVDSIHFNSEPFGSMCGVWIALEDIGPDQGPLVYYPGSHELPEMNYDDFDLDDGPDENYAQYVLELQKIIDKKGYQPELGVIKKGQAVVWSANIMHGGSFQKDKSLTRHSQVTHYYIGNPKCWRPTLSSKDQRMYFTPDWVEDMSDKPYRFPVKPLPTTPRTPSFVRRLKNAISRRLFNP